MAQSHKRSWYEATTNIVIGFSINYCANLIIFRGFGYNLSLSDNLYIGVIFTFLSLVRQFVIRRWFNRGD